MDSFIKGVHMAKKALITGITGQDGSYLAEFLLEKGYEVIGMVRRSSTERFHRIEHIKEKINIQQADLLDQYSIIKLLDEVQPDELYNLAAMSFVPTSWNQPVLTAEFTAIGVTRMLEAVRDVNPKIKFYQASSSEMFGKVAEVPIGSLSITGRVTIFLGYPAYYSTMNPRAGDWNL
jgi:GDPmannose 4,6-dehydratase